jgi:hypothetical protein
MQRTHSPYNVRPTESTTRQSPFTAQLGSEFHKQLCRRSQSMASDSLSICTLSRLCELSSSLLLIYYLSNYSGIHNILSSKQDAFQVPSPPVSLRTQWGRGFRGGVSSCLFSIAKTIHPMLQICQVGIFKSKNPFEPLRHLKIFVQ